MRRLRREDLRCFECLEPFARTEKVVTCRTNEEGVIHGVMYPKGSTVVAHERCLVPAEARDV